MKVRFWGTRGSIPTPGPDTVRYGGNTSCIEVRAGGERVILDAGSGIRELGLEMAKEMPVSCSVFISHTHWDHIHGLPFFVPLFVPGNQIDIYGPPNPVSMKGIKEALAVQMEYSYFPVRQSELKSTIRYQNLTEGQCVNIGDAKVCTCFTNHTVLNFGYRVEANGKSLFYTGDHEPYRNIYPPDNERFAEYEARVEEKQEKLASFLNGVDALVADAQYTEDEYRDKIGWGHSTFDRSLHLALRAGVKTVYLIHHDPTRTDEELDAIYDDLLTRFQHEKIDIRMASDNMEIEL